MFSYNSITKCPNRFNLNILLYLINIFLGNLFLIFHLNNDLPCTYIIFRDSISLKKFIEPENLEPIISAF